MDKAAEDRPLRRIAAGEAKDRFSELLDSVQRDAVTIENHGHPVAVLVSIAEYREFEDLRLARLRGEIRLGLDDVEAGRMVDGTASFAALRKRAD
jgi:prevent-host-death family protein